jgi:hypothetical protein
MKQVVADFEIALVSQDTMTSDPLNLHQLREELQVTVTSYSSSKFLFIRTMQKNLHAYISSMKTLFLLFL